MAELDHTILINYEMAGPGVAEVITPDLVTIVDHDGILDRLFRNGVFDFWDFLFVIDSRHVDADDNKSILPVFVIHLFYVRHCLGAERTVERPEIDEHDLAA